jgi:hypothetical protein
MRTTLPTTPANEPQRGTTTIRMADYQTRPATQASWSEMCLRRDEIRLPVADPTRR